jgi:hypothetical protein
MASGAGLNRVGQNGGEVLLTLRSSATALAAPQAGYGTIGVNDSGFVLWEAIGFTKDTVQLIGPGAIAAGYTVGVYGTVDPAARPNGSPLPKGSTALPASSWSLLPGQAATGGGPEANPLVSGTNTLVFISGGITAIRIVLMAVGSPTADAQVLGFLVP